MFLKLRPLLYSFVFLIGLESIVFWHRHVLVIILLLFAISAYQGRKIGRKWKFSTLPIFFILSSTGLLYLITIFYEQQIFIALASFMYYLSLLGAYRLSQYDLDQTARGMIMAATASTVFFTFTSAYGLYLNFLVPLWVLMLVYMIVTLFVSYQYFSIIKPDNFRMVWIYSFILALIMAEIAWALNFWPFGYLTTGTVALILYYIIWDLVQSHFLNLLSKKRMVANAVFFSVLILLILLSSKWIPVI